MDTLEAILEHIVPDDSADMLDAYLSRGNFSGAWFETIGGRGDAPEVANRFTPADVIAVSTLGVKIPGWAAVELLEHRSSELAALLASVPGSVELHDASDDDLSTVYALQDALDDIRDIGHVTRSKLLARKRPHLIPIRDQYVLVALVGRDHGNFTEPLREALRADEAARDRLHDLRAGVGRPELSLLRTLDIVVWMRTHGAESIATR